MDQDTVAAVLADSRSQKLMESAIPARLAYTAIDGDPRVVPLAFLYDGANVVVATRPKSPKVAALRKNPRVAITVDTAGFPPQALTIRGASTIEMVDGVPEVFLAANRKLVRASQFADWEAGVREMYTEMAVITIAPDWAKLVDFEELQ